MLLEFSIVPLGVGESLGAYVAKLISIVDKSGLPYKATPMGTVIEGDWEALMEVVKQCHALMTKHAPRVITTIKIDDRQGRTGMIEAKLASVERHLGKKISR